MAGVGTEEKVLCDIKKILPHHLLRSNFPYPTEGKQLNKGAFMLKYGICLYTTPVVKNYSSTPPNTAYFFQLPHHFIFSPHPGHK